MLETLIPTLISLAIIEILLSVDNALVNATIAENLPEEKRKKALRIGILLGAVFRVIALLLVGFIIQNEWLKVLGGLYLLYLAIDHLGKEVDESGKIVRKHTSYLRVIGQIALADIVFSLDNVVSAVSFSSNIWIVMLGVAIGVVTMLFATPIISKLIHKYKGLSSAAYVIVGLIGVFLLVEIYTHIHITEFQKFACILGVLGFTMLYETNSKVRHYTKPVLKKAAIILGIPLDIVRVVKKVVLSVVKKK
jgi:YkoY family integral membrane protein